MTVLVGYVPSSGGRSALDLATQIARSGRGEPVVVAAVVPRPWSNPSMARVDAEYAAWAHEQAGAALGQAREYLAGQAPDVSIDFREVAGRSVSDTLVGTAEEVGADLLVLGSSTDGRMGQVVIGSTAAPLLHSAPLKVALAPRGYRTAPGAVVERVSCSFPGTEDATDLLTATAAVTARMDAALRVVTFGVQGRTMYPPEVGLDVEKHVLTQWREQIERAQAEAVDRLCALGLVSERTETAVAMGGGWAQALDDVEWRRNEVLVVGSSGEGRLARVFLGSRAIKIVRHSPVPVVIVPSAMSADDAQAVTESI